MTDRQKATQILERLYSLGISPDQILEHIIFNFLSGSQSLSAMEDSQDEFFPSDDEEDEEDDCSDSDEGFIAEGGIYRG
jgi:hypothetical protein